MSVYLAGVSVKYCGFNDPLLCVCLACFGGLPFPPVCLSCGLCLAYFDLFFVFLVVCRVPVF